MANTKYVAGKPVEFPGVPLEDGSYEPVHYEQGEEVPGAADIAELQGLLRNNYLVPLERYDEYEAAESKDAFGLALADEMETSG